jgi:hypothetical protein
MAYDFSIGLFNSIKRGNAPLRDLTPNFYPTWTRSKRAIGGDWQGTTTLPDKRDDRRAGWTQDEMLEFFLEGMTREVRESVGGYVTWQGYVAEMELTLNGVTWRRSIVSPPLANACKAVYTRLFDNLLTNGGAESGAWTALNGATVTQSPEWVNTGFYSCKVVVNDTTVRGACLGTPTIAAGLAYTLTGKLKIVSGAWRVTIARADTGALLGEGLRHDAAGEVGISIHIQSNNTYAGAVNVEVKSLSVAGTCYGDSFILQRESIPESETGWFTDTASITEFGRYEQAARLVGMTSAAANAVAQADLKEQAWPKTRRPSDLTSFDFEVTGKKTALALLLHGYAHTLGNKYCLAVGTSATCSEQVVTILSEAEFVSRGTIGTNSTLYRIDDGAPIRHWQALKDIAAAGDGTSARWVCGVYAERRFDYEAAPTDIRYHFRRGRYYAGSGNVPLEPWFAQAGVYLYIDDAPVGPGQISGHFSDDPRIEFVSEVEMGPPTAEQPLGTLTMRSEVS